ncbi:MerR family transcriptional regulator [Streptomyces sp. NPDC050315]|uniref:helix-turn-helix domain-containing protein n=1 Tax=Streptomyces sp. NPDC050315 TaxID=3155039 RepID=UPI00342DDED2
MTPELTSKRHPEASDAVIWHWSDIGVITPAGRTAAGYRLYGTEALARLQLARTLRELRPGLSTIKDVLDRGHTVAEVTAVHSDALEMQIRTLRAQQAVLRSVLRRNPTAEGFTTMPYPGAQDRRRPPHPDQRLGARGIGRPGRPIHRQPTRSSTPS